MIQYLLDNIPIGIVYIANTSAVKGCISTPEWVFFFLENVQTAFDPNPHPHCNLIIIKRQTPVGRHIGEPAANLSNRSYRPEMSSLDPSLHCNVSII